MNCGAGRPGAHRQSGEARRRGRMGARMAAGRCASFIVQAISTGAACCGEQALPQSCPSHRLDSGRYARWILISDDGFRRSDVEEFGLQVEQPYQRARSIMLQREKETGMADDKSKVDARDRLRVAGSLMKCGTLPKRSASARMLRASDQKARQPS